MNITKSTMKSFKEILHPVVTVKFWKELVVMTLGMAVGAAAVYYFLMPSNLIIGSISGLSIVLSQILGGVKVSLIVTIINAVLLILAWILIGAEFGAKTVYTAMILGPLLEMWEKIMPYQRLMEPGATSVMNDPWFDLICFVLLLSISQAILFRINASTGGLDIIAKIVNKYLHFDIGMSVTVAGAMICCSAFAINPFRMVVIGLIGTWINGVVVDYFTDALNRRKKVCIISKDHETIRQFITKDLERGCTIYRPEGGFTGEEKVEIVALLTKHEYSDLFSFMKEKNIEGFITASNVSEIYGNWNTRKKLQNHHNL